MRSQILDVTERLLVETGDEAAVSIRAIAQGCGCTPPAIYMHFEDKDALIGEVCDRRFAELNAVFDEATKGLDDPLTELREMGRGYVRFGTENPEAYRLLMMTKQEDDWSDTWTTDEPTQGDLAFMRLVNKVGQCIAEGALRETEPLRAAIVLWSAVHGLTALLISHPKFEWPDEIVDDVLDGVMTGLLKT